MGIDLTMDAALQQVLGALEREVTYALRRNALPAQATPAALRAQPSLMNGSPTRTQLDMVYVTSLGLRFYWDQFSTATDDGATVVTPLDAGPTGRWILVPSAERLLGVPVPQLADGLVREVVLHVGDFDDQVLKDRIYGKAPCYAIHFADEKWTAKSSTAGALYDYRVRVEVWSVSRNYRNDSAAALGSPIPSEASDDPGALLLMGKVRAFLVDTATDTANEGCIGINSVKEIEVLDGTTERSSLAERVFVMAQSFEVRGHVHNVDVSDQLIAVDSVYAQRAIAQAPVGGVDIDLENMITSGCSVPLFTMSLTVTIAAGTAVVGGIDVAVSAYSTTFSAESTIYRDLTPSGTWVFTEVPDGEDVPAPASEDVRVAVTVTDSVQVVADRILCSMLIPSESPDQIDVEE